MEDKERIRQQLLAMPKMSDRRIATILHVDVRLVNTVRHQMNDRGELPRYEMPPEDSGEGKPPAAVDGDRKRNT